jgi:hypothetical protein
MPPTRPLVLVMENDDLCSHVCSRTQCILVIKTLPLSNRNIRAYPNGSLGTPILVIKTLPLSNRNIRAYPNGSLGTPILVVKTLPHESNTTSKVLKQHEGS